MNVRSAWREKPTEGGPPVYHRRACIMEASYDFFYLQSRGYPRERALEMVGNRHGLVAGERNLLRRGVFGQREALRRRAKQWRGIAWDRKVLVLDGHNVHITMESIVLGRMVLRANDGVLRDVAELSRRFIPTELSVYVAEMVVGFLADYTPKEVRVYFDAPMSRSGEIAQLYRRLMHQRGVPGSAAVVPSPERLFLHDGGVVASSDSAVMDSSRQLVDLPFLIGSLRQLVDLSVDFLFLERSASFEELFRHTAFP